MSKEQNNTNPAQSEDRKALKLEFSGKSAQLNCEPITCAILIVGALLLLTPRTEDGPPPPPQPKAEDIVIIKTGRVPEDEVVKQVRGLKPGQIYTHGREYGVTRQIQFGRENETGTSTTLTFFGVASQSLEFKFSKSLDVAIGHTTTTTEQFSVNGDKCPDHDIKVTRIFETAVVTAPGFSTEEIPIKIHVDIDLSADNLCDAPSLQ